MNDRKFLSLERIFAGLLLISAGLSFVLVLFTIASRISYPYSLERMEGASLLQVLQILDGQDLYAQPSIEYTALIYPPIYFYISAVFVQVLGSGFAPLRLVSSLAFAGSLAFIFTIVKDATRDKYLAFIAMSFFAATYPLSGIWFDVARVDSLFVFFCVAAIWFSTRNGATGVFLSSLFWILAVFTKQIALIAMVLSSAYLLILNFRKNIAQLSLTALLGTMAFLACSLLWGKWFSYFIFYLPTLHHSQDNLADVSLSAAQLLVPLMLAILISVAPYFADSKMRSRQESFHYYGYMACVMFGLSLLGRLNLGGYTNVYMPAHAMAAVMVGISLNWWNKNLASQTHQASSLLKSVVYLVCLLQFVTTYFDPRAVIPSANQANTWSCFIDFIALQKGDILIPELNYLPSLAGKSCFVNQVAVSEIFGEYGDAEPVQSNLLRAEIHRVIQQQRFLLVILKDSGGPWEAIANDYECHPFSRTDNGTGFPSVILEEYQACYPIGSGPESIDSIE